MKKRLDKLTQPNVFGNSVLEKAQSLLKQLDDLSNEIRAQVSDMNRRIDQIEEEDRKRAATQRFLLNSPINGAACAGLNGIEALLKSLRG